MSDGSPVAEAAVAMAADYGDPAALGHAQRAVELAEQAGDAIVHSAALDRLTGVHLARHNVAAAVRVVQRRIALLATLPARRAERVRARRWPADGGRYRPRRG